MQNSNDQARLLMDTVSMHVKVTISRARNCWSSMCNYKSSMYMIWIDCAVPCRCAAWYNAINPYEAYATFVVIHTWSTVSSTRCCHFYMHTNCIPQKSGLIIPSFALPPKCIVTTRRTHLFYRFSEFNFTFKIKSTNFKFLILNTKTP